MTTINAKPGGAAPKKSAQAPVRKSAAGPEREMKKASDARNEEVGKPDEARDAPIADASMQAGVREADGARTEAPESGGSQERDGARTEAAERADASDGVRAEAADPESDSARAAQDEELSAKYMRLAADFQNYKRRVEKEKSEVYAYANEKIVVDLLAVLDNFERALEAQGGAEAREEGFVKGMGLIFKQLQDILSRNGVEEIPSLGETFDPAMHHAVMMEETSEYESGKVSAVLGKGYRLRDRVIRPAMVKVAE